LPHLPPGQNWIDLVLFVYAAAAMPALSVYNGRKLDRTPEVSLISRYRRTMLRGWASTAIVIVVWIAFRRDFAQLGLDMPVGFYGRIGLGVVAAGYLFNAFMLANLGRFISPKRYPQLTDQMRQMKILPRTTTELLAFLPVAVTAGIWEELFYRGYLIWFLAPYGGLVLAMLLSSFIFGLGHGYQGWRGIVRTGVLGLVFAVLYVTTRSLWWVMAAHALVDVYGGTLAWRLLRMPAPQPA
jgi:membrane protease YdiL (CAAX protease family)